jgi:hypothetical protein
LDIVPHHEEEAALTKFPPGHPFHEVPRSHAQQARTDAMEGISMSEESQEKTQEKKN